MNYETLLLIFVLCSGSALACPELQLDSSLTSDSLLISWQFTPKLFYSQIQLSLIQNQSLIELYILDNSSITIPRPPPGTYVLHGSLLYPACDASNQETIVINPIPTYTYRSSQSQLLTFGFWLFFITVIFLCIILILRR